MEKAKNESGKVETKIGFKNLTTPLKTLVVFGWILLVVESLFFLVGFLLGIGTA